MTFSTMMGVDDVTIRFNLLLFLRKKPDGTTNDDAELRTTPARSISIPPQGFRMDALFGQRCCSGT